jgi:hypothetical protein
MEISDVQKMENQEHSANNEENVNHAFGDLEHNVSQHPKDNQNHGNCCKHFMIPLSAAPRTA